MNLYQEEILDHYKNPRNFGLPKQKATHEFKAENLSCGDSITIFLIIENARVKEASFTGEGCSIAIATASKLTENIIGKSVSSVLNNMNEDSIKDLLGIELTPARQKCALLSLEALVSALESRETV